ncbi:MAG TPA: hypothetical protein VEU62_16980 [Bryobacterales bacterium]|nr:hypothetical protein [Bryobacterales bacterium]
MPFILTYFLAAAAGLACWAWARLSRYPFPGTMEFHSFGWSAPAWGLLAATLTLWIARLLARGEERPFVSAGEFWRGLQGTRGPLLTFLDFLSDLKPLEWATPAGIAGLVVLHRVSHWNTTLDKFPDRILGAAVLDRVDISKRAPMLVESLLIMLLVVVAAPTVLHLLRCAVRVRSEHAPQRFRRSLLPAHVLGLLLLSVLALYPNEPSGRMAAAWIAGLQLYCLTAAALIGFPALFYVDTGFRPRPALLHGLGLAAILAVLGFFAVGVRQERVTAAFPLLAGVTVFLVWLAAPPLVDWLARRRGYSATAFIDWVLLSLIPVIALPAVGFAAQETGYFLFLRFHLTPSFRWLAQREMLACAALCPSIAAAALAFRLPRLGAPARLLTRLLFPAAIGALVFVANGVLAPAGKLTHWDVHHFGEALLPMHQWMRFGKLPYIDILPTHGLFSGLPLLLHRLVYGTYSVDAFWLGLPFTIALDFVAVYWFLRVVTGSPTLALFVPLLVQPMAQPYLGYAAPVYSLGLVVLLALGRAFRLGTGRAFFWAGAAILAMLFVRVDAGIALALVFAVMTGFYALAAPSGEHLRRARRAVSFLWAPAGAVAAYLAALFARSSHPLEVLAVIREFFSVPFNELHTGVETVFSSKVDHGVTHLFHFLLLPAALLLALPVAVRLGRASLVGEKWNWRWAIFVALAGYNVHIYYRGLGRFTDDLVGYGQLSLYSLSYSVLTILLCASVLVKNRKALVIGLGTVGMVLTALAQPPIHRMFPVMQGRLLVHALLADPNPAIERPEQVSRFSHRSKFIPKVEEDFDKLKDYTDARLRSSQTFAELGNQPLLYVITDRPFPGFVILMISTVSDTMQRQYVERLDPARVPVVVAYGGNELLNDVDGLPDGVKNYRIHERLHEFYRRETRVGPFVVYAARGGGPESDVAPPPRRLAAPAEVAAGRRVEIPAPGVLVGPGREAVVEFDLLAETQGRLDFRFEPETSNDTEPVTVKYGELGASKAGQWVHYRICSPLEFQGRLERLEVEAPEPGPAFRIRDLAVSVQRKGPNVDSTQVSSIYNLKFLPWLWANRDPYEALRKTKTLWSAEEAMLLRGESEWRLPLDLPAAPHSYIHIAASAPQQTHLYVNYAKANVPASTEKGFRLFILGGGSRQDYLIRPSSQPYWYGDRSPLQELIVANDSDVDVHIQKIEVRSAD